MDSPTDIMVDNRVSDIISYFDATPEMFAFREPIPQQIHARRARMSDVLIFDILLSSGNVRHPDALYPPMDIPGLHLLLTAIEDSSYDALKKDCLVYFLLKWHNDDRAATFREARCIPPQFVALADAYWCLDSGVDIPRAIALLSDARLNRDYTSKILQAISLSNDPKPFIRRYIRTAKPLLTEPDDIDAYAIALADSSLFEAWQYQQTFSEGETKSRLVHKIIRWCLTPKPRPQPLKQLLGYSFSNYEQELVHSFAVRPPTDIPVASIIAIQDLVCLRLVLSGQTVSAVKLNRQFPVGSSSEARRAAQERKQLMLDEAVALMPTAERQLLELELEHSGQNGDAAASGSSHSWNSSGDLSMSMSWEFVNAPPAKASTSAAKRPSDVFVQNPITPIPKRSGAPRFGGPISALANSIASPSFVLGRAQGPPQATTTPPVASTSRVRDLAAKFQPAPTEQPTVSLYDTMGSANMHRNAFYEPPVSAGTKRPLTEEFLRPLASSTASSTKLAADTSNASAAAVVRELMLNDDDEDVEMNVSYQAEVEQGPGPEVITDLKETKDKSYGNRSYVEVDDDDNPRELSFSLFSATNAPQPPKLSRTETEAKMPPGAFYPDSDVESEAAPPPVSRPRESEPRSPTEPPRLSVRHQSQPQPKLSTRSAQPRKSINSQDLGRSLPGSLMDDENEEEEDAQQEEGEDIVPPLPPISAGTTTRRQPARKSRASKGGDVEKGKTESVRPTRRSSRLSAVSVSSRGSSSPEPPVSPVKVRRTGRASIATPKKKSAARQR